ncbi:hypothetical protein STAFG_0012 [Streptomyces afghaniensis 772]|uniref:Uncharacterized protein n=1 Tax=Streptomyces afghaniensis 772 TaxID=1283301 RepID=S4N4D5_9ACTN|nr:hypothetical protein STAFG_0012 [Streptomyces afghaniensis 772]
MTGYGLENTGVKVTERGAIDVDERCPYVRSAHLRHR